MRSIPSAHVPWRAAVAAALCWAIACIADVRADEAPLADAAERQDWAAVERLVRAGADVNVAQVDGMTALHWATYYDRAEAALSLVDAGADVRAANRYGVTALALAAENGNAHVVQKLLDAGAEPNAARRGGQTVLMTAARTGRVAAVQALLAAGADPNACERQGQTALMWAAAEGHTQVVDALLAAGADYSTRLPSGFTAFLFAVREGHRETAHRLLAAGADVNEVMQPQRAFPRVPRRGTSALILAVENGHFQLALELVRAGADPNDERSGHAPLHVLTWVRKPNRGDGEDGDPPPQGSGNVTSLEFARQLVALGADVNRQLEHGGSGAGVLSRAGATPLLMAASTADTPLLRTLVELGADPHRANRDGATPLLAAAGLGTLAPGEVAGTEPEVIEAVEYLLGLGADINAVDASGETVMHAAAYKSLPRVVQLLAERGARPEVWNRANRWGWTPLNIAEGHRPGNFRPSPETIAAIRGVMP